MRKGDPMQRFTKNGLTATSAALALALTTTLCLSPGAQAGSRQVTNTEEPGHAQLARVATARCLFISSYHQGYAWSDGVERGLRSVLEGQCEIKQFDMDTKRHKSDADKRQMALEAKALVESWRPDVVITADDNAAKYVIQPYFKDHQIPFVFCGVNWTVEEYGFPYSNVTGIIEVAPIRPMIEQALEIIPGAKRVFYLGADTLTEKKNLERFQVATQRMGMTLDHSLAASSEDWLAAYHDAQAYDFIILGSNAGINDWDPAHVQAGLLEIAQKLTVTNHGWMMPFTMLGVTKVPEEHGEWAGKTALAILGGVAPSDVPIIANSRHDVWINEQILGAAEIRLPKRLAQKGKKVGGLDDKS